MSRGLMELLFFRKEPPANHLEAGRAGAGQSVRNTAKITGKGVSTVQRVKLALAKVEKPCRQAIATSAISNRSENLRASVGLMSKRHD